MTHKLYGSIVALVTPMTRDFAIDWRSLAKLIDFHLENGTHGIVVNGTTGESPTVSADERKELISFTLNKVAGKIPVIAGTGSNCTRTTIASTQAAFELGVDACLLVVPYYNKPNQAGLTTHFTKVAESCSGNLILYNVPSRTVADLLPETVASLSNIKNIIGIKEATGDLDRLIQLKKLCADDFIFFTGEDRKCFEFMQLGGHGVISVTANIAPNLVSEMYLALQNKETVRAEKINTVLDNLNNVLFLETNPAPVKWAMHLLGLIGSEVRLPLVQLTDKTKNLIQAALHTCGMRTIETVR
jgi:4-hydroxy-tetrahydrodipicolinate synthase